MEGVKSFLDFVRYCIDEQQCVPTIKSWNALFLFMQQQALVGIGFRGLKRMNAAGVEVPRDIVLQWYAMSEQIKLANQKMNRIAVDLVNFSREEGFRTCVLKGQGNALYYPDPYLRMSGDIDIWVEGGVNVVLPFSRRHFSCSKACYHHVDAGSYQGVEVEVHYRPLFMNNLIHNKRLQRWFEEQAQEQFMHEVELPDGAGCICVPTHYFNCIYQISHIYNHVIHEGVGLRQLVDYYYLLKAINFNDNPNLNAGHVGNNGLEFRNESLESTLRYLGLYKVTTAVMWVLHEALGLEEKYLIVPPNEKLGKFLLDEIMRGGNFGQYNTDGSKKKPEGQVAHNLHRLQRDLCLLRYFPSEALCEPLFRTWHFFWRKWR